MTSSTSRRGAGPVARARYRFDLALARGPMVVIGYLGVVMLAIILVSATLLTALHLTGITVNGSDSTHGLSFGEAFWQSLLRVLDSGTFASDTDWPTRIVSLVVTIAGIFLAGSLIGLIANAVDQRIELLRKGRSEVLEQGHTLVLGWSPRLPSILSEIVLANANHPRRAFVVLADRPKDEMEDELRRLVPRTLTTRVVCRTGDVGSPADLALVNVAGARSVIVLAGEQGDAGVVKAVLAARSVDPTFERLRLVAELEDAGHAETLRSLTDGRIATVHADEVISQVTAQACHQGGLASVFRDLLDFDGDEIYFQAVPELSGRSYREAVGAFEDACVIGVLRDGVPTLNPPADHRFTDGDEVIAIAADDDRIVFSGFTNAAPLESALGTAFSEPVQRIALIGWSPLGATVLRELDHFLGAGSHVDVLIDGALADPADIEPGEFAHCTVAVHAVPPGPGGMVGVLGERRYDQAIVLGYRSTLDAEQADARTMLTLLALHRAWSGRASRPRVVAEMRNRSNVAIAQTTGVDDFIVSDELSSLMMAQLSERLELQAVFAELFDAVGCFVSLQPAVLYAPDGPTSFASIVATAAERGVTALGYRVGAQPAVLNPAKSATVHLGATDQVLVLAPRAERTAPALPPASLRVARPRPGSERPPEPAR